MPLPVDLTSYRPPVAILLVRYTVGAPEDLFSFIVLLPFVCAAEEREKVLAIHVVICHRVEMWFNLNLV